MKLGMLLLLRSMSGEPTLQHAEQVREGRVQHYRAHLRLPQRVGLAPLGNDDAVLVEVGARDLEHRPPAARLSVLRFVHGRLPRNVPLFGALCGDKLLEGARAEVHLRVENGDHGAHRAAPEKILGELAAAVDFAQNGVDVVLFGDSVGDEGALRAAAAREVEHRQVEVGRQVVHQELGLGLVARVGVQVQQALPVFAAGPPVDAQAEVPGQRPTLFR